MDASIQDFAVGIADLARRDIEAAVDRALKKSGTGRTNRALATLRDKALTALDRIADGLDKRMPAAVLDEVLSGIVGILHPAPAQAIAKRASEAAEAKPEGEKADIGELEAIAKEFRELADRGRKLCNTPNTTLPFAQWEQRHRSALWTALHNGDAEAARALLSEATASLGPILDDVKLDRAIGEKHIDRAAAIPNFRSMR